MSKANRYSQVVVRPGLIAGWWFAYDKATGAATHGESKEKALASLKIQIGQGLARKRKAKKLLKHYADAWSRAAR